MLKRIILLITLLPALAMGQAEIISGRYGALSLAFDKESKLVTGYYENASGWDEQLQSPRFSCAFYFSGVADGNKINIKSLFPKYAEDGSINGTLEVLANNRVKIQLAEEHGGCPNVEHFAGSPVEFSLEEEKNWMQLRYITVEKAYFYSADNEESKTASYVMKGDIVYVEKVTKSRAYCSFTGRKVTRGWLNIAELNSL